LALLHKRAKENRQRQLEKDEYDLVNECKQRNTANFDRSGCRKMSRDTANGTLPGKV
jgi:hypothetical protein